MRSSIRVTLADEKLTYNYLSEKKNYLTQKAVVLWWRMKKKVYKRQNKSKSIDIENRVVIIRGEAGKGRVIG